MKARDYFAYSGAISPSDDAFFLTRFWARAEAWGSGAPELTDFGACGTD
jgi:hypothetical protein